MAITLLPAAVTLPACTDITKPDRANRSYTIDTRANHGGSITPANLSLKHGSKASFKIVADAGYYIARASGCSGTLSSSLYTTAPITASCKITVGFERKSHVIETNTSGGGSITPQQHTASHGNRVHFTITPDTSHEIDKVAGCAGSLSGNTYTINALTKSCRVTATFRLKRHIIGTESGPGGSIIPSDTITEHGATANFTIQPKNGYRIDTVTGCDGKLSNQTYTTAPIQADCSINVLFLRNPPATAATAMFTAAPIKQFRFSWTDIPDATYYRLLEDLNSSSGYIPITGPVPSGTQQIKHPVLLPLHTHARYILQSCNEGGCNDSSILPVNGLLTAAIGYFKAGNTGASDQFGYAVALSGDGNTLAVGAPAEDSGSTGVNGGYNNTSSNSGAVYIYRRTVSGWFQQAFIKADNTGAGDRFGYAIALNHDGNRLAVGAPQEDGETDGNTDSGAAYLFSFSEENWRQLAYLKADNGGTDDQFGYSIALSSDGSILAVGSPEEDGGTTDDNGFNDAARDAGAVYIFTHGDSGWFQQAYLKAANAETGDRFGSAVTFTNSGNVLAVGAPEEDSGTTGVNGDAWNNSKLDSGAVYLFQHNGNNWIQQTYIKASNTGTGDRFGHALSLSGNGATLAVGAWGENSASTGINGNENDNSAADSGAVYLFTNNPDGWQQILYIKPDNNQAGDRFGWSVSLNDDGTYLAAGARLEDSAAIGIDGDPADNSLNGSGAGYLFVRNNGNWIQRSYIKASNTGSGDQFGRALHLSGDGNTLAISGYREDGGSTGINGEASTESKTNSGAVYLY